MIVVALLVAFGGLFAAMAIAPAAIDEMERADAARRNADRRTPVALPVRQMSDSVVHEHEPSVA